MKKIAIELEINDQQEAALLELLEKWQGYTSQKDGSKPFADWTLEKVFQTILECGSTHTIWHHIKEDQFRWGLITSSELIDNKYLTAAEREAERAAGQQEGAVAI